MATEEQLKKAHLIIHGAAASATAASAAMAQGSIIALDTPVLMSIHAGMAVSLGELFDQNVSNQTAMAILGAAAGVGVGVYGVKAILGLLPGIGTIANATISGFYTEALGWWCFSYFDGIIGDRNKMSDDRTIITGGGNYYESIDTSGGNYIQGDYINMSQDLTHAAAQIQHLIEQLQKQGVTVEVAKDQVAQDMATQAQSNPTMKNKLIKWGQSLGDATVSDVVKGVVKLAIRSAGIPLP